MAQQTDYYLYIIWVYAIWVYALEPNKMGAAMSKNAVHKVMQRVSLASGAILLLFLGLCFLTLLPFTRSAAAIAIAEPLLSKLLHYWGFAFRSSAEGCY
jgi:hypothetical protein